MDEAARNAVAILKKLVTDRDAKLQYGIKRRAEMLAAIARGEEPIGYRADFIRDSVRAIFHLLAARADEFNLLWPQDRISTADFSDILTTAMNKLKDS